jgi:hypothetical protein
LPVARVKPNHRPDWQALPAPHPALRVCVVVPVRNESRRLGATLAALAAQVELDGTALPPGRVEALVLANNCQDGSAELARRFSRRHPALAVHVAEVQFPPEVAHVGHARASLMDEARRRLGLTARADGVIASTDGDTRVDRHWVAATLTEFAAGADAVGGRIVSRAQAGDSPALRAMVRRDHLYRQWRARLESLLDPIDADPWPRHHQHFGASLAVSVRAYDIVGGCPAVPWLEDEALVRALHTHDLRVRHSLRVKVVTSGRRQGRVEIGLSQQLRAWAAMAEADEEPAVHDPAHEAVLLRLRARLRAAWRGSSRPAPGPEPEPLTAMATHLQLAPDAVRAAWHGAPFFGAFCHRLESLAAETAAPPMLGQQAAIRRLRRLVRAEAGG